MKPPVEYPIHNSIGEQQMKQQQDYPDYGPPPGMEEQMMGAGGTNFNKMDPVQIGD